MVLRQGGSELAENAYRRAIPLEEMVQPSRDMVFDVNLRSVSRELRSFLTEPQDGARAVAKRFFEVIARIRTSQFSAPGSVLLHPTSDSVFDPVPGDVGHFGRPYYDHVLRGLRRSQPEYVTDLLLQRPVTVPDGIAGLVVVHL